MTDLLPDFRDWSFLAAGSADQRRAYAILSRHRPFDRLAGHDAGLAGTFPIDIAVPGSDLDILVQADNPAGLGPLLDQAFGSQDGYTRHLIHVADGPALVAGFALDGVPVEVFVQSLPVDRQMGWRHMLVEARLLALDPSLREPVRALKATGVKTEPAFARLLGLADDPYAALLGLADWSDTALSGLLSQRRAAMPKQG